MQLNSSALPLILGCIIILASMDDNAIERVQADQQLTHQILTTTSTTQVVRLRSNRIRRPEMCRENLLSRKAAELPKLVITGRIREVYLTSSESNLPMTISQLDAQTLATLSNAHTQRALVTVNRVIKGDQSLVNGDIIVIGFNGTDSSPCPNFIKPNDTWIMLLDQEGDRKYSIQGQNLINLNLANLDKINSLVLDEPLKRRPTIEDILCEAHYCPFGRCKLQNEQETGSLASTTTTVSHNDEQHKLICHCPDSCSPSPNPICGSDNATYTNECHLIKEGCRRQRPLFITKQTACQ